MSLTLTKTELRFVLLDEKFLPEKIYFAKEKPINLHGGHYQFENLATGKKLIFSSANRFLIEEVKYDNVEFGKWAEKKEIEFDVKTALISLLKEHQLVDKHCS